MTTSHHEFALLFAVATIAVPGVLWGLWTISRKRVRRAARREMSRRNKICADWMNQDEPGQA